MPFCFTTQLHQKAVATELAALRRLAKANKPPATQRNLHGKASQISRPQVPARKATPR